jgi:hypothetical protein
VQPGDLLCVGRPTDDARSGQWLCHFPDGESTDHRTARAHIASAQVLRDRDFQLLDLFHEIAARAFNPRLPTLQNTDGDPPVACAAGLPSTAAELTHRGNPAEDQQGRHLKTLIEAVVPILVVVGTLAILGFGSFPRGRDGDRLHSPSGVR